MCLVAAGLADLIDTTNQALPRLAGEVGEPRNGQLVYGCPDNPEKIAELHGYWTTAHPEAGVHYWSIRSWSLLIWQPVYFSLLAVHLGHRAPSLTRISQTVEAGVVGGFCLPVHSPRRGRQADLIAFAAEQLGEFIESQLTDFNRVCQIYPKMARLLAADCARAALLWVNRCEPLGSSQLLDLEGQWMDALALSPGSSLIPVQTDDGRECLALGRKVCCQHFRRADGELCATCPKLKPMARLERLREESALQS
jgi:siderophore ferric iron reductase